MAEQKKVKFIRKNGRIIPIKVKDAGKGKALKSLKHGRVTRAESAKFNFKMGAALGSMGGLIYDFTDNMKNPKVITIGPGESAQSAAKSMMKSGLGRMFRRYGTGALIGGATMGTMGLIAGGSRYKDGQAKVVKSHANSGLDFNSAVAVGTGVYLGSKTKYGRALKGLKGTISKALKARRRKKVGLTVVKGMKGDFE